MMEKTSVPYDTMSVNSVGYGDPMFSKCCCCIPLRIGCFILGYINLFINCIRTLLFVGVTIYFGLKTYGFDHFDAPVDGDQSYLGLHKKNALEHANIQVVGGVLVFMTLFELIWLSINIVCLVGIHKKRPGHIRTYVGFATFRLLITILGYMYQLNYLQGSNIFQHCIEFGLSAYFILVYYIYAMRLEKEDREPPQLQVPQSNDVSYIYPTKLDKSHLVV